MYTKVYVHHPFYEGMYTYIIYDGCKTTFFQWYTLVNRLPILEPHFSE